MLFRYLTTILLTLFATNIFAFDEANFASSLGLEKISEGHPFNFMGINTIYVNDTLGRQLLVVSDVPGELKEMRIIHHKDFFILEIPKSPTSYASMALVGIAEEEIKTHLKTTSVFKTIFRELNPIPRAYSQDCSSVYTSSITSSISGIKNYFGGTVAKGAAQCIGSFLQGIWDATGGQIADAWEGIKNLVNDPKEFWDGKVQQFKNLKNFIMNFEVKIKQLATSIANLPDETKTMLICNFVGGIGAGAAVSIISGGAGAAGVMLKIENYVSKIMKLEKVFATLNRVGKLGHMPPSFFQRLTSGKIPDKTLKNLDTFASHGMPDVIQGAMQCAL